ncbi:ParM/StbA family protein [Hydrogenophaga sp. OTU3427]|uniref:ParM/StbA family protein n=1 Tax=Hydrogenophaga sp. OTU3427 TaxID=3043856 RepID=UPI00313DDD29
MTTCIELGITNHTAQAMQQARSLILKHIGVDVGFYTTKYTTGRSSGTANIGSKILTGSFPSLTAPSFGHRLAMASELDGVNIKLQYQSYFVGQSACDLVDAAGVYRVASENYCKTEEYKALMKGSYWHIARHHKVSRALQIENLVVGLPLNTVFEHADFLEQLCTGSHALPAPHNPAEQISVEVGNVMVVAQPQGAVVNYVSELPAGKIQPNHLVLVFDMGGGTFDWFVCKGDYNPRYKVSGAHNVGTLNCAAEVCAKIKESLKRNPIAMERADIALRTGAKTFDLGGETYNTDDYWPQVIALMSTALSQALSMIGDLEGIDHVVLTGGGSPILARALASLHPGLAKRARQDIDPVYGNVRGFHRIAEMCYE